MSALNELAERLKMLAKCLGVDSAWKAHRIVAELAKVQEEEDALYSMENITAEKARNVVRQRIGNCILKCRAIAEEGDIQ